MYMLNTDARKTGKRFSLIGHARRRTPPLRPLPVNHRKWQSAMLVTRHIRRHLVHGADKFNTKQLGELLSIQMLMPSFP
jgi:hypothetical protein